MSQSAGDFPEFRDRLARWAKEVIALIERADAIVAGDLFARTLGRGRHALDAAAERQGLDSIRCELEKGLEEVLSQKLRIGLMGIFSVGKSSLVNAMFRATGGWDVREIGKHPVDVDITILTHGPDPGLRRTLEEGKHVRIEEVTYPFDLLRRLTIVDTPGTDELKIRDQAAIEYLKRLHVLLYLFLPDHVLAEGGEQDFLDTLLERYQELPRLYVVTHLSEFRVDPTAPIGEGNVDRAEVDDWIRKMNDRLGQHFPDRKDVPRLSLAPAGNTWFVDSHPRMTYGVEELVAYLLDTYNETTANAIRRRVGLLSARNSIRDLVLTLRRVTKRARERLALVGSVRKELASGVEEARRSLVRELAREMVELLAASIPEPRLLAPRLMAPVAAAIDGARASLALPPPSGPGPDEEELARTPARILSRYHALRQKWIVHRSKADEGPVFGESSVGRLLAAASAGVDSAVRLAVDRRLSELPGFLASGRRDPAPAPALGGPEIAAVLAAGEVDSTEKLRLALDGLFREARQAARDSGGDPTEDFLDAALDWASRTEAQLGAGGSATRRHEARADAVQRGLGAFESAVRHAVEGLPEALGEFARPFADAAHPGLERVARAAGRQLADRLEDRLLGRAQVRLEAEGLAGLLAQDEPAGVSTGALAGLETPLSEAALEPVRAMQASLERWRADLGSAARGLAAEVERVRDAPRLAAAREEAIGAARSGLERCRALVEERRKEGFDPSRLVADLASRLDGVARDLSRLSAEALAAERRRRSRVFSFLLWGASAATLAVVSLFAILVPSWAAFGLCAGGALASLGLTGRSLWQEARERAKDRETVARVLRSVEGRRGESQLRIQEEAAGPIADREVVLWGDLTAAFDDAARVAASALARIEREGLELAALLALRVDEVLAGLRERLEARSVEAASEFAAGVRTRLAAMEDPLAGNLARELEDLAGRRTAPLAAHALELVELRRALAGVAVGVKERWNNLRLKREEGPGSATGGSW